ncbi:hypothetical protein K8R04_04490 [Candidatus Uhrbacteria bacterium]|nr:hypothetical protein [Candidatus Uhrbacteria bacterium]
MARTKPPFLSAFGVSFEIFKAISDAVIEVGGNDDSLRSLLNDPDKCRRVALEIVDREPAVQTGSPYRGGPPSDAPGFRALVEYAQPAYAFLEQAFDWVYDGYKSAKFTPIDVCKDVSTESREIEFELVHLNKGVSTDKALAELDKQVLRPALYEELLAFAVKYPELQKQFPIVALGSVYRVDGYLCSPYVLWDGSERRLHFSWFDGDWSDSCRFLAVRKQP